jgi:hypothetical protein
MGFCSCLFKFLGCLAVLILGVVASLGSLVLIGCAIAFPVEAYVVKDAPFVHWTPVQIFSPLIAMAALTGATILLQCIVPCVAAVME